MEIAFLIGRIVLGLYYVSSGFNHFKHRQMMVGYAKSMKAPMPEVMVPVTGLMLIAGGLSFLTGLYPTVGVALVVVFLVPVAFIMHKFCGSGVDPQTVSMQKIQFMKNMALAGSALMFLAIPQPWVMSLVF